MLIDESYFEGELGVPNTNSEPVLERLNYFIQKYEPLILQDVFGYELYSELDAALEAAADQSAPQALPSRFDKLVNGTTYTGQDSYPRKWNGLTFTTAGVKRSLVANYVYWQWLKDQQTQVTGLGEVKSKAANSVDVSVMRRQADVWNEMSKMVAELYYYLLSNRTDFPEWKSRQQLLMTAFYKPSNQFGI